MGSGMGEHSRWQYHIPAYQEASGDCSGYKRRVGRARATVVAHAIDEETGKITQGHDYARTTVRCWAGYISCVARCG